MITLRARAFLAALLLVHGLSPWILPVEFRRTWWWFADPLGTQPWLLQSVLAYCGAWILLNRKEETFLNAIEFLGEWYARFRNRHFGLATLSATSVCGALLWLGRSIHLRWGDGDLLATRYQFDTSVWSFYAPIATALKSVFCTFGMDWWHTTILARLQLESVAIGAVAAPVLLWLCQTLWGAREGVWWWLLCCSAPVVLLWFGHIEIYTLSWTVNLVFVLLVLAYLENDIRPHRKVPLWAIAFVFSLSLAVAAWNGLYVPIVVYLLWRAFRASRCEDSAVQHLVFRDGLSIVLALAIPVIIAVNVIPWEIVVENTFNRLLFFGDRKHLAFGFKQLVDPQHLVGMFQVSLSIGLPGFLAVLLRAIERDGRWSPPRVSWIAAAWLILPVLLFAWRWYPMLGLPWDWDLYHFMGGPLALGLPWILLCGIPWETKRRCLGIIVLVSGCIVVPWLLGNNLLVDRMSPVLAEAHIKRLSAFDGITACELAATFQDGYHERHAYQKTIDPNGLALAQSQEPDGGRLQPLVLDAAIDPHNYKQVLVLDIGGRLWLWREGQLLEVRERHTADWTRPQPSEPPSRARAVALALDGKGQGLRLWENRRAERLSFDGLDGSDPCYEIDSQVRIPVVAFDREEIITGRRGKALGRTFHLTAGLVNPLDSHRVLDAIYQSAADRYLVLDDTGVLYDVLRGEPIYTTPDYAPPWKLVADDTHVGIITLDAMITWAIGGQPAVTKQWPAWTHPSLRDLVLVRDGRGAFALDFAGGAHAIGEVPSMERWYAAVNTVRFGRMLIAPDESVMYEVDFQGRVFPLHPTPKPSETTS